MQYKQLKELVDEGKAKFLVTDPDYCEIAYEDCRHTFLRNYRIIDERNDGAWIPRGIYGIFDTSVMEFYTPQRLW